MINAFYVKYIKTHREGEDFVYLRADGCCCAGEAVGGSLALRLLKNFFGLGGALVGVGGGE